MKNSCIVLTLFMMCFTSNSKAGIAKTINGWDGYNSFQDFLAPGYLDQYATRSRYFRINGELIGVNIHGVGLNDEGYAVAHLYNWPSVQSDLGCHYIGYTQSGMDPEYALGVGEKPSDYLFVADDDHDGIYMWLKDGVLRVDDSQDNGHGVFDRSWWTDQIKFNGVLGGIDQMPPFVGATYWGPYLPSINLVPEPATVLMIGFGTLLMKKFKFKGEER